MEGFSLKNEKEGMKIFTLEKLIGSVLQNLLYC